MAIFSCTKEETNGVAVSVGNLRKGLVDLGHEVHIFAPGRVPEENFHRFPFVTSKRAPDYPLAIPYSREAFRALREMKFDVIHTHHPWLMGNLAIVVARLLDLPCVSTVHTQYELLADKARPIPPALVKRALLFSLKRHAKQVDLLTTPGGGSLRRLLDLGIKTPIELVSNPTDLKQFWGADGSAIRSNRGILPEQRLIGYVGRLSPEKNLPVLLDAFDFVAQFDPLVHLMIVGDGPSRQELQQRASARLSGRVSFAGRIPHEAIAPYYAAFDFFATASMFEVQPMTLAESLAVGTPVVGFNVAGINDMIDFENGRLVSPESGAPGLALAMISLLRDPLLLEMLSRKAIRSAERFEQSLAVGKMLEAYEQARDLHCSRRRRGQN